MALFDIFRKKAVKTEVTIKEPEYDEDAHLLKLANREKNALLRQRMQIDLQNMRLEAQRKQQELEEDIADQREERQLRRLERQARRAEIEAELFGEDEEDDVPKDASPESMLFSFLNTVMKKQSPTMRSSHQFAIEVPSVTQSPPPVAEPEAVTLSPSKITEIWSSLSPQHKSIAKQMSDDDLRTYIISEVPNIDQQSLNVAIQTVRGQR